MIGTESKATPEGRGLGRVHKERCKACGQTDEDLMKQHNILEGHTSTQTGRVIMLLLNIICSAHFRNRLSSHVPFLFLEHQIVNLFYMVIMLER